MENRAYFNYKGIDSRDMYLYIVNDVSFPSPQSNIEFINILGRDGEVAIDNERLESVDFLLPVQLRLPTELRVEQYATEISNWLKSEPDWYELFFSGSEDYKYIAMCYEQFDIAQTLTNYGKTVIKFKLKPYKRIKDEKTIKLSNGTIIQNQQSRISKPLIKIKGNGNITFKNNDEDWLTLFDIDEEITIDSELMSIYKNDRPEYTKMSSNLDPLFPIIYKGENIITWKGDVDKVEIIPRWEAIM